jgi:hypothetical protein
MSNAGAPVVIKGALITKLILMENNYDKIRQTNDIDMNWVEKPFPSMEELTEWVNKSLSKIQDNLYVTAKREYIPDVQAAGFRIFDKNTGEIVTSIDINAGSTNKSKMYNIENAKFQGVLPSEILADKICVLSCDRIFRRPKDVMDVYALSHCVDIEMTEILNVCEEKGRKIDTFDNFCNRRADLEHAYNKLTGINNKPPFDEVYTRVSNFILPFVEKNKSNRQWNHKSQTWNDLSKNKTKSQAEQKSGFTIEITDENIDAAI